MIHLSYISLIIHLLNYSQLKLTLTLEFKQKIFKKIISIIMYLI